MAHPISYHHPFFASSPVLPLMLSTTLLIGAMGCKSTPSLPEGPYMESTAEVVVEPETVVVPVPYAQPVPGQAMLYPPAAPSEEDLKEAKTRPTHEVIDEANKKAQQQPSEEGYFNAIQTYDYMDGALYQVYSAPNHLTVISFGEGEQVLSYAAGDTIHWIVEKTESGPSDRAITHLLVEPIRNKLHTDMLVTTDCCVYTFELRSFQHTRMSRVRFLYPKKKLERAARQAKTKAMLRHEANKSGALSVHLDRVESRYDLIVKDKRNPPEWTPTRVFHDGDRTFIEFPDEVGKVGRPALFLLNDRGQPQIQQHKVEGRYYIIPRVIRHAILRLGDDDRQSVGIELSKKARK